MFYKSYPKINLYLHILGKTASSYHLLRSRFVRVVGDLYDEITISQAPKDSVLGNFPCAVEDSSVYRALRALRSIDGVRFPPVRIEVCKHIPSGAGLGGGSSNAGVVLAALISRYGREFKGEAKQMHTYFTSPKSPKSPLPTALGDLAKSIGADVAFFVSQVDCAEVSGIGECIEPCDTALSDIARFHIYTPKIACDTAQVYRHYAATSTPNPHARDLSTLSNAAILASGDMASLNDLFAPACSLYKELESVAKELGGGWYFSGSGSSFFRIDSTTANPLESTFSCGDSALSRHSADFGDLEATADLKSSSAPKSPKNSKSPTANPRILEEEIQAECEKSTANKNQPQSKKVDSSNTAHFAAAKTMDCHATATQCLAMTENNAVSEKVDSRIFDKNAEVLKVDSRKQAHKVETSQNTRAESVFDNKPQGTL
ncbi:hypothetical protein [Helicobacter zhangjianzhongii]|uniref:GHMP family kinase ATP-binding protein n=1 Tax=Helicobacter zhangjianzhongii TaxID=2974574 RepID=UPI00255533A8|nr:hypothetical protein [Helicobacter sp. CPD2-1]MDL0080618.1 hypothetical protein [Helicobacter sp. CPD2-1]